MKLLLDENLPHELRKVLPGHEVFTARYMGWSGKKNGDLLAHAGAAGFDAVITMDSGVQYQQNMATLPLSVIILSADSNDMEDLRPLLPRLSQMLISLQPKTVNRVP